MAKKAKSGPNKSLEIRNYKSANPTATPKEVAEALDISVATVHVHLSRGRRRLRQLVEDTDG